MGSSQPILKNLSDYKQNTNQHIKSASNQDYSRLKTNIFKRTHIMSNLSLHTTNSTPFNSSIITATEVAIKMTSQEIADLVQSRHDDVKRSIERLVTSGVIIQPPMADEQSLDSMGRTRTTKVYVFEGDQGERDTTIIVAQLSPLFLGQLVDQWRFLKQQVLEMNKPSYMIEDRLARARKWIEEETAKQEVEAKLLEATKVIEVTQPKADVYDIISNSDNTYTIRVAAKLLKVRPKDLTDWLLGNKWMYGKSAATYRPSAQHDRNHLKLIASQYGTQVRVTGKGLVWIARKLNIELATAESED